MKVLTLKLFHEVDHLYKPEMKVVLVSILEELQNETTLSSPKTHRKPLIWKWDHHTKRCQIIWKCQEKLGLLSNAVCISCIIYSNCNIWVFCNKTWLRRRKEKLVTQKTVKQRILDYSVKYYKKYEEN